MNQDQVKEKLLLLSDTAEDFSVIFSGKKNKLVNGLYHPESKEIIIHNKNFNDDNSLIYTAIHEFAHHVHFTTSLIPISSKAHTNEFWNIFHNLLQTAEEKQIYSNIFESNPEFHQLTQEIRKNYLSKNGQLMKDFGKLLIRAVNLCQINNIRFEDYVDRALLLNRVTANTIMKVYTMDINPEIGFENMKIVSGIKDDEERKKIETAFVEGQSPDMVKAQIKAKKTPDDSMEFLQKEKNKIEKTIDSLNKKLDQINERMLNLKESQ